MQRIQINSEGVHYAFDPTAVSTWYSIDRHWVDYHLKLMNQPPALSAVLSKGPFDLSPLTTLVFHRHVDNPSHSQRC